MPRSSSFMFQILVRGCARAHGGCGTGRLVAQPPRHALPSSAGEVGLDGDRTVDDALRDGVELTLEVRRDLALEVVERRQADTLVLERADERRGVEVALAGG